MKVKYLIEELEKLDENLELELMIDGRMGYEINGIDGDHDEGWYLEGSQSESEKIRLSRLEV